jgi:signal transduction histidine kinase
VGDAVSFRTKVILTTAFTVAASVWIVALVVSAVITRSFEQRDAQRTQALVGQFQREFARRGEDLGRRLAAIAGSQEISAMAAALAEPQADIAPYLNDAGLMAQEQGLDFLELVGPEGRIVSSAQWPARYGYKEDWLLESKNWTAAPAFLKREELPDGSALGLFVVRTVPSGTGSLYIAGGQRLDRQFLDSLVLPAGMRLVLWDGSGAADREAAPLIDQVRNQHRELSRISPSGAETLTALPLMGRSGQLLAVLVAANSRQDLLSLKNYIQRTAIAVGCAGVLVGILLSFWSAARVTRPLRELTANVRQVASGDWDVRTRIASRDDIGRLAADFNQMTTQLVEQKQRIIQTERVAAWRELARRLAHELKNPLFPLQITIENLQRAREQSPEQFEEVFRESTSTLLAELQNLKLIIGRFSDFAKMPAPQFERVDVNALARAVMGFFEAQFHAPGRPEFTPRLDLEADVPAIQADPDQLRRALRNLVLNAMDAMPQGGAITLRTRRRDRRVAIEVSDTGEGLTTEECERLFTPYYTTKRHGTGLGLAIVQSVVADHHGAIAVESEPGKGATFRMEFDIEHEQAAVGG